MNHEQEFFAHESSYIDEDCQIGEDTKIWHFSHIMGGSTIGKKCSIGQNVVISSGVILGDNVKVQNNVSVYSGVVCEDDVFLGPSMVFTNVINPRSSVNRRGQYVNTIVKKGATIGANATIICGNIIGKYAFVGAGSVVTRDVQPYSIIIGNPGRHVGWMSEYGHRLVFDTNQKAICSESGHRYVIIDDKVNRLG